MQDIFNRNQTPSATLTCSRHAFDFRPFLNGACLFFACNAKAKFNSTLSSGSIEGVGLQASEPQNLGVACGFMAEGSKWIEWLLNESGVNRSICTELYERLSNQIGHPNVFLCQCVHASHRVPLCVQRDLRNSPVCSEFMLVFPRFKWKRQTINAARSFEMFYPHIGVSGNVHVEDIAQIFLQADPLGLRGRMLFFYTRPRFCRLEEIHAANEALNTTGERLSDQLVRVFYKVRKAHLPIFAGKDAFKYRKDYPFRVYTLAAGDAHLEFKKRFDFHVAAQEENFLEDHEAAKNHGKLKCKHARLIMNFGNLLYARDNPADDNLANWPTAFTHRDVRCAYLVGDFVDALGNTVKEFFAGIMKATKAPNPAATMGPGPQGLATTSTSHQKLQRVMAMTLADFTPWKVPSCGRAVWEVAGQILAMQTVYIHSTFVKAKTSVLLRNFPAQQQADIVYVAMVLLRFVRIATVTISTNTTSSKLLFLVKRPLVASSPHIDIFLNILSGFDMAFPDYKFPQDHMLTTASTPKNMEQYEPLAPDFVPNDEMVALVADLRAAVAVPPLAAPVAVPPPAASGASSSAGDGSAAAGAGAAAVGAPRRKRRAEDADLQEDAA